jgi:hypothetical protein
MTAPAKRGFVDREPQGIVLTKACLSPQQYCGRFHLFVLEGRRKIIQLRRPQSDLRTQRKLSPVRYHGMHLG